MCGSRLLELIEIEVGPKRVDMRAQTESPAKFAHVVDLWLDAAVVQSRIEFENNLGIAAFAPDLPNEFMFGP